MSSSDTSDSDEHHGLEVVENPLYKASKRPKLDPDTGSDSDCSDDWESDDDSDEKEDNTEPDMSQVDPEDTLIQALKKAKEKRDRTAPPDIVDENDAMFTDVSFHPESNLLAVGSITGHTFLYEVSNEKNERRSIYNFHKKSVRSLEFDSDGGLLYSGSADKSFKIIDVETSQVKYKMLKAHPAKVYKVKPINEWICASGDDDGYVKLWDHRVPKSVMEEKPFDGHVSDFFVDEEYRTLVASSGELSGHIQAINIRGKKLGLKSEDYEGELSCLGMVHRDSKLVAGCGNGRLYMFNWGEFGFHSAEFPGHPAPINTMVSVTDNIILTGCDDNTIRAVHLYPHRFLGSVGHHDAHLSCGIERMDVNSAGDIVASIADDARVKFWNIDYLENMDYNKTKKPFLQRKGQKVRRKENKLLQSLESEHQLPSSNRMNKRDFFKDL